MTSRACSRLAEPNPVLTATLGVRRPAVVPVHARGPSNYPLTCCSTSSPFPQRIPFPALSCSTSPLLGIRIARTCFPWLAKGDAVLMGIGTWNLHGRWSDEHAKFLGAAGLQRLAAHRGSH